MFGYFLSSIYLQYTLSTLILEIELLHVNLGCKPSPSDHSVEIAAPLCY